MISMRRTKVVSILVGWRSLREVSSGKRPQCTQKERPTKGTMAGSAQNDPIHAL